MLSFDFTRRTAFVTGAASGIGREVALAIGRAGGCVACVDRDPTAAGSTADEVNRSGGKAISLDVDVSNADAVNQAVAATLERFAQIDYLVNCAGIIDMHPIEDITDAQWHQMVSVHLSGTFFTCRAVLPGMMKRRFGAIVNTGSIFGIRGQANAPHYAAVKAGIMGLTKSLARDKGPFGIRVNAVVPGPVMTKFFASGIQKEGDELKSAAEVRAKVIPLGTIASADQVAPAYLFLLSDGASHVTGEGLVVDGGEVMA